MQQYLEEISNPDTRKMYGTRVVRELPLGRVVGYVGKKQIELTESTVLNKGHKSVIVTASPSKPIPVFSIFYLFASRDDTIADLPQEAKEGLNTFLQDRKTSELKNR